MLYWLVSHLYTTCTICDYWRHICAKSNWCIYFDKCQNFFDFSDYIVRHDNSSVHVQGSYGPYKCSKLQIELVDIWSMRYPSATTLVSIRNTPVFRTALTAPTEPRTLWRRIARYPSPRRRLALHTYSFTLWWRLRAIRWTRVLHSSQGLQLCWSRLHNAWRCLIIATNHSMIFKTYAFSLYSHLCIYVSI